MQKNKFTIMNHNLVSILVLVSVMFTCRPKPVETPESSLFTGYFIDTGAVKLGKPFDLQQRKARGAVINFYSPNCVPCIDELPALNVIHEEAQKRNIQMFLALEGKASSHGIEKQFSNKKDELAAIAKRMHQDILKYNIRIPVVVLDGKLKIRSDSLVTATPETLYFKLNPAVLVYNFIGPISSVEKPDIQTVPRLAFAIQQLDGIVQRAEAY